MYEAIKNSPSQFLFDPVVEAKDQLFRADKFIVCGVGGSNLAAGLFKTARPTADILLHRDYGLPRVPDYFLRESMLIVSSYSGDTEETLDAFDAAYGARLHVAALSTGGKLLERAKERGIPHVQVPATGIQPRSALGFMLCGLLKLMGEEETLSEVRSIGAALDPGAFEQKGRDLAAALKDCVPVIYASNANLAIAYNWKIKLNETGKIPAFYNVLPELNHNEMTGFDVHDSSRHLSERFHFIVLEDPNDHPRILRRIEVLQRLYAERGLPMTNIALHGHTVWEKIFSSLMLADWTAYYTAQQYGLEAEQVPMVEQLKKLIAE